MCDAGLEEPQAPGRVVGLRAQRGGFERSPLRGALEVRDGRRVRGRDLREEEDYRARLFRADLRKFVLKWKEGIQQTFVIGKFFHQFVRQR